MPTFSFENLVADEQPNSRVSAPAAGSAPDLKSFLTTIRRDRAPLESSNSSNCRVRNNVLYATGTPKSSSGTGGKAGEEHDSKAAIGDGERFDVGSGALSDGSARRHRTRSRRLFAAELSETHSHQDRRIGEEELEESEELLEATTGRILVGEEAARDSFRKLFGPKGFKRSGGGGGGGVSLGLESADVFQELLDVDEEVGFGEDEHFAAAIGCVQNSLIGGFSSEASSFLVLSDGESPGGAGPLGGEGELEDSAKLGSFSPDGLEGDGSEGVLNPEDFMRDSESEGILNVEDFLRDSESDGDSVGDLLMGKCGALESMSRSALGSELGEFEGVSGRSIENDPEFQARGCDYGRGADQSSSSEEAAHSVNEGISDSDTSQFEGGGFAAAGHLEDSEADEGWRFPPNSEAHGVNEGISISDGSQFKEGGFAAADLLEDPAADGWRLQPNSGPGASVVELGVELGFQQHDHQRHTCGSERDLEAEGDPSGSISGQDRSQRMEQLPELRESGSLALVRYHSRHNSAALDVGLEDMALEGRGGGHGSSDEQEHRDQAPSSPSTGTLHGLSLQIGDGVAQRFKEMQFEDLQREAEVIAVRGKKTDEEFDLGARVNEEKEQVLLQQQRQWSDKQKELEGKVNLLELQHGRLEEKLRETAGALATEQERRRGMRMEVDKLCEMLQREKRAHQRTVDNLNACVNSSMKLRGSLAMQVSRSTEEGGPSYLQVVETVLRDMDQELQTNLSFIARRPSSEDDGCSRSSDMDEFAVRWKQQRDALERERDGLEESMKSALQRTRERHEETEDLWLERETLLEQKVGCLEVELRHSEREGRRRQAEVMAERQKWAEEAEGLKRAWASERDAWNAALTERDEDEESSSQKLTARKLQEIRSMDTTVGECLSEASDLSTCFYEGHKDCTKYRRLHGLVKQLQSLPRIGVAFDQQADQLSSDFIDLVLGMNLEDNTNSEERESTGGERELEMLQWKAMESSFEVERQEMEQRRSDAFAEVEEWRGKMEAQKAVGEMERRQMQALLLEKVAELDKVGMQLKSKEHDMEVIVQKFMDEVRLIDKEVEKERKEREQVMELHFASKRKVITDMNEKEEKWERQLEATNQDLDKLKIELWLKDREVEQLKAFPLENLENLQNQLSEARAALQALPDELRLKDMQLDEAKASYKIALDRKEKELQEERDLVARKDSELALEIMQREENWKETEALKEAREREQIESAKTISSLQGVVRELEWVVKQTMNTDAKLEASVMRRSLADSPVKDAKLAKLRTSHLDEVDRYILEVEAKMEASECFKSPTGRGSMMRGSSRRRRGASPEMNKISAMTRTERELFPPTESGHVENFSWTDDMTSSTNGEKGRVSRAIRDWEVTARSGRENTDKQFPSKSFSGPLERNMCLTLNGLTTLPPQDTWSEGGDDQFAMWQLEDRKSERGSLTSWMSPRSSTEETVSSLELPGRAMTTSSSGPSTTVRRQQKWVVDVSWLDQVRKEHAWLKQQLDVERHRIASLGRVEADNRWIEAAIVRALELKRDSDSKAADMQRKMNIMEVLMTKTNTFCQSP